MDAQVKKQTLRMISYGMYVMTATDGDDVAAGSVSWLSQCSFNPSLVMVAVKVGSGLHALVEQTGTFAISILASDQKEIASAFFRSTVVEGDTINGYRFESGPETGAPLLVDLPAWFEARVGDKIVGGDHTILVAEVINAGVRDSDADPMVLAETGWSYGG